MSVTRNTRKGRRERRRDNKQQEMQGMDQFMKTLTRKPPDLADIRCN